MNDTPRKPLTPDRSEPIERSVADVGGIDGGPVIADDYELTLKDKRIDAMSMLLRQVDDRLTSDTSRRAQEELDEAIYDTIHYYDRWVTGRPDEPDQSRLCDRGRDRSKNRRGESPAQICLRSLQCRSNRSSISISEVRTRTCLIV